MHTFCDPQLVVCPIPANRVPSNDAETECTPTRKPATPTVAWLRRGRGRIDVHTGIRTGLPDANSDVAGAGIGADRLRVGARGPLPPSGREIGDGDLCEAVEVAVPAEHAVACGVERGDAAIG